MPKARQLIVFHKHYGSDPLPISSMWFDLTTTSIPEAMLADKEKTYSGLKMYLVAHYFLRHRPKNSVVLADTIDETDVTKMSLLEL